MLQHPGSIADKFRSVGRARTILRTLIRFGFDEFVHSLGLTSLLEKGIIPKRRRVKPPRESVAVRVRKVLQELGPTFIKVGQILSTRPDLIPPAWAEEFKKLQADIEPDSWESIEPYLRRLYDDRLDEAFEYIDPTPLAAASLAQVHKARLVGGQEVVIKILRPGIREMIQSDMEIMDVFAALMEKRLENRGYSPREVVEQFSTELERETDLLNEAGNTERMRLDFADDPHIKFPIVYREVTNRSVLAMEYIDGVLLTRRTADTFTASQRLRLVRHAADAVFRQCLDIGFFHADPHPGNIFVLEDQTVCFIDCGMTGRIDPETKTLLAMLVQGVIEQDLDRVLDVAATLGGMDPSIKEDRRLRADVWRFIDRFKITSLSQLQMGRLLNDFFELLRKYNLKCPADLVYLIKAITTIEGVGEAVAPEFDFVQHVRPYLERLIRREYSWRAVRRRALGSFKGYAMLAEALPRDLRQLLEAVRRKRLSLTLEHSGLKDLEDEINRTGINISFSVTVAALVIGSALLVLADSVDRINGWLSIAAGVGFVLALALGVLRLVIASWRRH
ncbi:MAG: ABC1 kinase family protein [Phycisphaerae bacterium]